MTSALLRSALALLATLSLGASALAQQQPAAEPAPPAAPEATASRSEKSDQAAQPAPASPFAIYGTLNVNLQYTQAEGASDKAKSVKPRTAVSADSTNLGIKGTYDVAGGLQVVFQCETGASVNGASVSGICNRNSRIGLGSPAVGTLFFGNWDTPYRATPLGTKADDPFLSTDVYDYESILTSPGFNTRTGSWVSGSSTPVTTFAVRANNTVAFHSASFAGVNFKLAYAADTFKNPSGTQDPTLYSAALNYDRGSLSLMAGAERHEDAFALVAVNPVVPAAGGDPATGTSFGARVGNTAGSATAAIHSSDSAWHVGAGYQLDWAPGSTTVGGLLEQIVLEQSKAPDGAVKRYDRIAWQVSARHRLGNHELRARYSAADKGKCALAGGANCSTRGYGASDIAIGYAYYLAKAAQVYAYYTIIQNGRNAQYTFGTGGAPAVAGATPPGADPTAAGLGIRYAF